MSSSPLNERVFQNILDRDGEESARRGHRRILSREYQWDNDNNSNSNAINNYNNNKVYSINDKNNSNSNNNYNININNSNIKSKSNHLSLYSWVCSSSGCRKIKRLHGRISNNNGIGAWKMAVVGLIRQITSLSDAEIISLVEFFDQSGHGYLHFHELHLILCLLSAQSSFELSSFAMRYGRTLFSFAVTHSASRDDEEWDVFPVQSHLQSHHHTTNINNNNNNSNNNNNISSNNNSSSSSNINNINSSNNNNGSSVNNYSNISNINHGIYNSHNNSMMTTDERVEIGGYPHGSHFGRFHSNRIGNANPIGIGGFDDHQRDGNDSHSLVDDDPMTSKKSESIPWFDVYTVCAIMGVPAQMSRAIIDRHLKKKSTAEGNNGNNNGNGNRKGKPRHRIDIFQRMQMIGGGSTPRVPIEGTPVQFSQLEGRLFVEEFCAVIVAVAKEWDSQMRTEDSDADDDVSVDIGRNENIQGGDQGHDRENLNHDYQGGYGQSDLGKNTGDHRHNVYNNGDENANSDIDPANRKARKRKVKRRGKHGDQKKCVIS